MQGTAVNSIAPTRKRPWMKSETVLSILGLLLFGGLAVTLVPAGIVLLRNETRGLWRLIELALIAYPLTGFAICILRLMLKARFSDQISADIQRRVSSIRTVLAWLALASALALLASLFFRPNPVPAYSLLQEYPAWWWRWNTISGLACLGFGLVSAPRWQALVSTVLYLVVIVPFYLSA